MSWAHWSFLPHLSRLADGPNSTLDPIGTGGSPMRLLLDQVPLWEYCVNESVLLVVEFLVGKRRMRLSVMCCEGIGAQNSEKKKRQSLPRDSCTEMPRETSLLHVSDKTT